MKIALDPGAHMPSRAHDFDGGLDLYAKKSAWIRPDSSEFFDTGVHMEIPKGYVGLLRSRSGLMARFDATTDGTIDYGYTGSIGVKLFNHSHGDVYIKDGDRIAQIVIVPCIFPVLELVDVDELEKTERGAGGFGSTGR